MQQDSQVNESLVSTLSLGKPPGSLPVLSAHSFTINWLLPFLIQQKGENGRRNQFMTNLGLLRSNRQPSAYQAHVQPTELPCLDSNPVENDKFFSRKEWSISKIIMVGALNMQISFAKHHTPRDLSQLIMALFVLCKLIFQTRMRSHPLGLEVWFLVGPFVCFHTSCVRTAKALAILRGYEGSPEPSLLSVP